MAQVKNIVKFQDGGKTSPVENKTPPKNKFIFGNTEYEFNDDFEKKFIDFASSQKDVDSSVYNDILTALREGKNVIYNPVNNILQGVTLSGVNPEQSRKLGRERTGFEKFTSKFSDSKTGNIRAAIDNLKNFNISLNTNIVPEQTTSTTTKEEKIKEEKPKVTPITIDLTNPLKYEVILDADGKIAIPDNIYSQSVYDRLNNLYTLYQEEDKTPGQHKTNYDLKGFDFEKGYAHYSKNKEKFKRMMENIKSGKMTFDNFNDLKFYNISTNYPSDRFISDVVEEVKPEDTKYVAPQPTAQNVEDYVWLSNQAKESIRNQQNKQKFQGGGKLKSLVNQDLLRKYAPTQEQAILESLNLPKVQFKPSFQPTSTNTSLPTIVKGKYVKRGIDPYDTETGIVGEGKQEKFNINKLMSKEGALSLASLIGSGLYNRKIHEIQDKAILEAMSSGLEAPAEIYENFNAYGVPQMYEQKAIAESQYKPVTSDALLANALEASSKSQANQTRLEGNLKAAELYNQYLARNNDLKRRYAEVRSNVANQNRQMMSQLNMARAENKAARLVNDYQGINNWLMEKRQNIQEEKNKSEMYDRMWLNNKMSEDLAEANKNIENKYLAQYNADTTKKDGESFETWLSNKGLSTQMRKELIGERNKLDMKYGAMLYGKSADYKPAWYTVSKKDGGKIPSSRYMSASDRIWVNQNQDLSKAVKLLNQNIIRLFLSATSNANKKI